MDPSSGAVELAAALRRRELSPLELLEACLARVDELNPVLNAMVWRNDEQARHEARRWENELASAGDDPADLPPFAGVPLPVKDLTRVQGWPVTFGSRAAADAPSIRSELVVDAFRRAGFVLCGRTNTPELGPIPVAENSRYGMTRNPWDTSRTPGGSSGGAGAAVAAGMFPLAHGSDGGGSIRIPSSCCGLVGLKPSRGRVPGLTTTWMGAHTEGALCRTVEDAAAVLDAISYPDTSGYLQAPPPRRPYRQEVAADPGRLRIGVLTKAPFGLEVAPAPREAVERTAGLLGDAGHQVAETKVELASLEMMGALFAVINTGIADYPEVDPAGVEPHIAEQVRQGRATDSIAFVQGLRQIQLFARELVSAWGRDFDVLLTPTMAIEPPAAGTVLAALHENPAVPPLEVVSMATFTAPFNVTGQPAVSLPLHWTEAGLPIGVQLVGTPFDEVSLIRLASQLENLAPWAERRPSEPIEAST